MFNPKAFQHMMVEKGVKGRDLARTIGVSEVSVSRYASGERTPRMGTIIRIAEYLETIPETLCADDTGENSPETALTRVRFLAEKYAAEWSHNERLEIVGKIMW